MLSTANILSQDERKLLGLYRGLDEPQRRSLLDFAEFLRDRGLSIGSDEDDLPGEPLDIPRPDVESVVKAIKRLTATYPMIDTSLLFNETSGLMTQHIMAGREAAEVIDDLEALFFGHYQQNYKEPK